MKHLFNFNHFLHWISYNNERDQVHTPHYAIASPFSIFPTQIIRLPRNLFNEHSMVVHFIYCLHWLTYTTIKTNKTNDQFAPFGSHFLHSYIVLNKLFNINIYDMNKLLLYSYYLFEQTGLTSFTDLTDVHRARHTSIDLKWY